MREAHLYCIDPRVQIKSYTMASQGKQSSLNQCIMLWHNNYVIVSPSDPRSFEYEAKATKVYANVYYNEKGDLQIRLFGLIDQSPLLKPRRRHQSIRPRRHKQVSDARLLMRHSSGFEWDATTKKFTAPEEVWEDYFKSHPTHRGLRNKNCDDYEDLQIVIGNATATGKNSLGLGDETDARTFGVEDRQTTLDDLYMMRPMRPL
ncbi:hypothetical protein LWI28_017791 [Acer negundo]|uniref:Myb/SANT-like domain-containing protein n=1 Tax=Acer negundo TaxID=4023 RepID=A0AAD5IM84_ACENE|nr:hypothetical protein LWI28_017791 [Acer negundo]